MIDTIQEHQFVDVMARENNGFSYRGASALFQYLEDLQDSIGQQIEFDPVAFRCEYAEYENLKELKKEYDYIETIEDLEQHTTVIEFDGGIIIQQF